METVVSFIDDLNALSGNNWYDAASRIEMAAREELLRPSGLVRAVKKADETLRKQELESLSTTLSTVKTLDGLDKEVLSVTDGWLEINKKYANKIFFDYWTKFREHSDLTSYPNIALSVNFMDNGGNSQVAKSRLAAIIGKVVNSSQSQSAKSNAGTAGETLVRSILQASGLKRDVDFREQFKSTKGSDTDFVIPNVADFQDHDLEVLIAVQISSNDRTRLSTSELKKGGQAFVVTGNGLSASSKALRDIGVQIVAQMLSDNVRMVCYNKEIEKETKRLGDKIKAAGETASSEDKERLRYFSTYAISFETFAKRMKARYAK